MDGKCLIAFGRNENEEINLRDMLPHVPSSHSPEMLATRSRHESITSMGEPLSPTFSRRESNASLAHSNGQQEVTKPNPAKHADPSIFKATSRLIIHPLKPKIMNQYERIAWLTLTNSTLVALNNHILHNPASSHIFTGSVFPTGTNSNLRKRVSHHILWHRPIRILHCHHRSPQHGPRRRYVTYNPSIRSASHLHLHGARLPSAIPRNPIHNHSPTLAPPRLISILIAVPAHPVEPACGQDRSEEDHHHASPVLVLRVQDQRPGPPGREGPERAPGPEEVRR